MRIGYVNWSLGLGGAEQVIIRLALAMAKRGHAVTMFTLNDPGAFAAQLEAAKIPVVALHKRGRYDASVLWRLTREFRARRLDVVHTHLWGGNLWGRLAASLAGVPSIVVTEHNVDAWKPGYYVALDRLLAPVATALVAVSDEVRGFYESRRIARGRWQVIYNGIDTAQPIPRGRGAAYDALGIAPGPVIGWIGRFVEAKAPGRFVEAMRQVCAQLPAATAVMVGDGPLLGHTAQQVQAAGLSGRVVLTGLRHDVPQLLAGMDVLACSSEREGLSMAMLEAMAGGVPIVATRVGGTPELIEDGVSGVLVEPKQPEALARALVDLLGRPARMADIRIAAAARVEQQFSLRAMVDAYEAVYRAGATGNGQRAQGGGGSRRRAVRDDSDPSPVRVAYVIDDLALGGAQRQLVQLVTAVSREAYEPHVISLSSQRTACVASLQEAGIPVTLIAQQGKWSASAFRRLTQTLRRIQPDIVYTWLFTADLYGRLAAKRLGVRVVLSAVRSVEPDKPWHYVVADRLLRHLTDAFTVNARAIGEVLQRREHVSWSKITVIYNGLDLGQLDPSTVNGSLRRRLGIDRTGPVVGIVGRLAAVKDHDTFLRAAAIVARHMPSVRFVVAGGGPLEAALKARAAALELEDKVFFLGSRSNVADVFSSLDVLAVTSFYEGCSNAILEGMAMGKPVVATAVGGNPELVLAGKTGLLVPPKQPEPLAAAILQLLRNRALMQEMGQEARRMVEARFTVQRMVAETTALYDRLLAARGAGR